MKTYIGAQELFDDEFDMTYPEPYPVGKWRLATDGFGYGRRLEQDFESAELWKACDDEESPELWVVTTTEGRYRNATDDEWMACNEYSEALGNIQAVLNEIRGKHGTL
jgi:hypothetical protein